MKTITIKFSNTQGRVAKYYLQKKYPNLRSLDRMARKLIAATVADLAKRELSEIDRKISKT
jgi:hypothetical protein